LLSVDFMGSLLVIVERYHLVESYSTYQKLFLFHRNNIIVKNLLGKITKEVSALLTIMPKDVLLKLKNKHSVVR